MAADFEQDQSFLTRKGSSPQVQFFSSSFLCDKGIGYMTPFFFDSVGAGAESFSLL